MTLACAAVAIVTARPGRELVGLVVGVALAWSAAPILADLLSRVARGGARDAEPISKPDDETGPDTRRAAGGAVTVTTLVRLGDEPDEIVRATVLAAAGEGPTAIVTGLDREVPEDLAEIVPVHRGEHASAAIAAAMDEVDTDAVHLVSARSIPRPAQRDAAALALQGSVAWACGAVRPFTRDGFAPGGRDVVGAHLRARSRRAGLDVWEPDATLVRSEVLRADPLPVDRPWGSWLRQQREAGWTGVADERTFAFRTTPLDPDAFWPDAVARQRAAAADLAAATASGPLRSRVSAALLLMRELYVVSVLGWLTVPVLLGTAGDFPFGVAPVPAIAVVAVVWAARWATLRVALDVELRPLDDVLAALHHLPGSAAALTSALTRRVRAPRAAIPTRPLVWAALLVTVLAGSTLADREPGQPVSKVAVGTALGALALMWSYAMRAMVERGWRRRIHRTPMDLTVEVEGQVARSLDGSPTGLAVQLPPETSTPAPGRDVALVVHLDDGTDLSLTGTVASRRQRRLGTVLGMSLSPVGPARTAWLAQVLRAADDTSTDDADAAAREEVPTAPTAIATTRGWRDLARLATDRTLNGLVTLCTLAVVALLVFTLLGFRPLVVRSGSMVPTLGVGDLILAEEVPASEIEVGQIVTQPQRRGPEEALTHRVVAIEQVGELLRIETLGDANDRSESWTVAPDRLVGVHRATVPWVGRLATGVRTSAAETAIGVTALALVAAATVGRRRAGPQALPATS